MEGQEWDEAGIRELLSRSDRAVERAVLAIQEFQTEDEKRAGDTRWRNGVGWSGAHARSADYYCRWIRSGKRLSGRYLVKARKMTMHYAGQLAKIAYMKENCVVYASKGRMKCVCKLCLKETGDGQA